jgi:hypothetical protein
MALEERIAARTLVVRASVDNLSLTPLCPVVSEEMARRIGPLVVELWRLMVEKWLTARNTPQPLSMTIMDAKEVLQHAWALEEAACHSETESAETSKPNGSTIEPPTSSTDSSGSQTSSR